MYMCLRRCFWRVLAVIVLGVSALFAQDDATTQNGSSAYGGGFITGPASNPLSFLNGPAYRTFGQMQPSSTGASPAPYDFPEFRPATLLSQQLPHWIWFGWEERDPLPGLSEQRFKLNSNDSAYTALNG